MSTHHINVTINGKAHAADVESRLLLVHFLRENLKNADFTRFNAIKPRLLEVVDNMLATDIGKSLLID